MKRSSTSQRPRKAAATIERSSGNVFADLALADSMALYAKAELAAHIRGVIVERGLTQSAAARLLGVDQPTVSALARGQLRGFSSDRLFRFLNALGCDVEISVSRNARAHHAASVFVVPPRMADRVAETPRRR